MTTTEAPAARSRPTSVSTTDLALVASFAALIAACALVGGIPVGGGGVDLTLQTFGVLLAGAVLGPVRGFLAVSLYLGLGAIGLPVFSSYTGGLSSFTGASAGYLLTFPLAAAIVGLGAVVVGHRRTRAAWLLGGIVVATLVNHGAGMVGMKLFFDVDWWTAATYDAPFWFGDALKGLLVAMVAAEVHRAFPQLLSRR